MINPYKNGAAPRCKHILCGVYDRFYAAINPANLTFNVKNAWLRGLDLG